MNTTTKAQRINKRQDAIWEKAKSLATANPPKAKRAHTHNGRTTTDENWHSAISMYLHSVEIMGKMVLPNS